MKDTLESYWHALYTKSRHEKFIHSELTKRKIESFLPLRRIKRRWSDRTVTVEEPLFKSYLFVKMDCFHRLDVMKIKGSVRLVGNTGNPVCIQERVIQSLKNLIQQEIILDPFPYLSKGDRVRVRSGLFQGIEGYIVRKEDKACRLVISIDAIMSSISVEVDSCLVEKV